MKADGVTRVAEALWNTCPDEDKLVACLTSNVFEDKSPRLAKWSSRGVVGDVLVRNVTGLLLGEGVDGKLSALVASRLVATDTVEEAQCLRDALVAEARARGKEEELLDSNT